MTIDKGTKEDFKKHNIVVMTPKKMCNILEKVERRNMKKYRSSTTWWATYGWVYDRCILKGTDGKLYVFKDKFDAMVKAYSQNKIHSPVDFDMLGFEKFNVLGRLFAEGNVGEC